MNRTVLSVFNNKRLAGVVLSLILFTSFFILSSGVAYGANFSESAFELEKYTKDVNVSKDHSYKVEQTFSIDLPESVESIKMILADGSSIVRNVESNVPDYVISTESGTQMITFFSPEMLTEGRHDITVSYTIKEVAERDETKDKFYYNVMLPEWKQPIGRVDISIQFPEDYEWGDMNYYAGQFGVQDQGNKVKFDVDKTAGTVRITGDKIPSNFGITIMGDLPNGYWENPLDGRLFIRIDIIILAVVLFVCFVMWFFGGRDPRVKREKITHPIDGISPAELGFIFDGRVMYKDIIALILYLGTKGYLRISEYEPRKYRLFRLSEPKGEEKFIRNAYNILFDGVYENRSIDLDDAWPRLARIMDSITPDIESGFSTNDMLARTPVSKVLRIISIVLASACVYIIGLLINTCQFIDQSYQEPIVAAVISFVLLVGACLAYDRSDFRESGMYRNLTYILCVLFALVPGYELVKLSEITGAIGECAILLAIIVFIMLLALLMNARGKGNAQLVMKYRSLRRFIYKSQQKTVSEFYREDKDYYYNMIPYAYLFSGLETWAKSFRWLGVSDPEWYSDDIEGHALTHTRHKQTTIDVARSIKSFCRTLETGFDSIYRRYLYK